MEEFVNNHTALLTLYLCFSVLGFCCFFTKDPKTKTDKVMQYVMGAIVFALATIIAY